MKRNKNKVALIMKLAEKTKALKRLKDKKKYKKKKWV